MSDLRTRIAAALKKVDEAQAPWAGPVSYDGLADAVIAELGLRQETVYAWNNHRSWPTGTRWVTDWKADNEAD